MKKNIPTSIIATTTVFIALVVIIIVLSINLVNCHTANKKLRKTVVYQANVIDLLTNNTHNNNMYVGLVK